MGISKGDIILKINETKINDTKDLQDIERINQAIYKIQFFNMKQGMVTKTYKGKRKTLGVVPLPRVLQD